MAQLFTFHGADVERALANARAALGDGLLVVTTRRAASGGVEVVALPGEGSSNRRSSNAPKPRPQRLYPHQAKGLGRPRTREAAKRSDPYFERPQPFFAAALPAPIRSVDERLRASQTAEGLREAIAAELVRWREERAGLSGRLPGEIETLNEARTLLAERLRRGPEHPLAAGGPIGKALPRAVALVGPTGVGKTTTLAKLAGRLRLDEDEEVVLVTLDTYRVAAVEQLRAYADMLDVPFHVTFTPQDLRDVVRSAPPDARVLVDTTGRSPRDLAHLTHLRGFLGGSNVASWLVLAAPARPSCLLDAAERFGALTPGGLVLTKLDETDAVGEVLSFAMEQPMPVMFTTAGQEVPEDIDAAPPSALADLMLGLAAKPAEVGP